MYRVISKSGTHGRIVWRASTDAMIAEVRTESERLTTLDDFVRVSLDWDDQPLVEVRDV